jgi:hypothetical protein
MKICEICWKFILFKKNKTQNRQSIVLIVKFLVNFVVKKV